MRRAITLETVTNPDSIPATDLDSLIVDFSAEIQELFPEDPDAHSICYGLLSYNLAHGWKLPERLESDQVEDWILGRVAMTLLQTQEHRKRATDYLATKPTE